MFQRLGTLLLVLALAGAIFFVWSRTRDGYGLADLLTRQPVAQASKLTPAERPPLAPDDVPMLVRLDEETTRLIDSVAPAVVSINTTRILSQQGIDWYGRLMRRQFRAPGLGSGVIISKEGHVVTNYHVIEGVDEIQVVLHDGTKCLAKREGEDRDADIALLRIINPKKKEYQPLPFADSDKAKVGQLVFAIGTPFGLRESVTRGIISHRERQLSDSDAPKLQFDTVINPGNSGGPLVNVQGEILGINVAIFAGQQDVRVWQGVGLAIPANDVRRAVERIRNNGREHVGYLGLRAETQTTDEGGEAVILTEVLAGSAADKAGLKPGDVILKFGGQTMTRAADFFARLARRPINQPVELEIMRGDARLTITAIVADRETALTDEEKLAERRDLREQIGIEVQDLSERQRRFLPENIRGVLVTAVEPGSPADGKILIGNVIFEVDRTPVDSAAHFFSLISERRGKTFPLRYIKAGMIWTVEITLPD
jgi:serine protease Do